MKSEKIEEYETDERHCERFKKLYISIHDAEPIYELRLMTPKLLYQPVTTVPVAINGPRPVLSDLY